MEASYAVAQKSEELCSICLELIDSATKIEQEQSTELKCHHFFHQECIQEWLKHSQTCPNCRASVGEENQVIESIRSRILEQRNVRKISLDQNSRVSANARKVNTVAANIFGFKFVEKK